MAVHAGCRQHEGAIDRRPLHLMHVGARVGEDEAPFLPPLGGAVIAPFPDQILLRLAPALAEMNRAVLVVTVERPGRLAAREVAGSVSLPCFALPADAGELLVPDPLGDRPECRPRLDRLQLLGIADQHHFGAALGYLRNESLKLAAADHPGFRDDQHVASSQPLPALPP